MRDPAPGSVRAVSQHASGTKIAATMHTGLIWPFLFTRLAIAFRAVTIYITLVRLNLWRILQTLENKCKTVKTAILTPSKPLIINELSITP